MSLIVNRLAPLWAPENEGAAAAAAADPAASAAPAPAPAADPAAAPAADPAAAPAPAAAATTTEPAAPADGWKDKRIAQLTARLREASRPAPAAAPAGPAAPLDPVKDFDSRVAEAAARQASELVQITEFNRQCNAAAAAGREKYGAEAFNTAAKQLQTLITPGDQASQIAYTQLLSAALETGEAPRILFELGNDPDEAMRLMGMTPLRMTVELTKRVVAAPADTSSAPKPITPVDSRGGRHEEIAPSDPARADNLPIGEWMKRRNAEVAAQPRR